MRVMKPAALLLSLFLALPVLAQELAPDELVRKVTADVLDAIQSDKQLQAGDRKKALALAEAKILPHVDFREATQIAMGRSWHVATPAQQAQLVDQFRELLIRIYASSIDVYRGQTMKVFPTRLARDATEARVRNQYIREGRPPVAVDYAMLKTPTGWKIYDVSVEGISLVLAYRSEFENIVRTAGIDGLIKRLAEKNA
jgi:phospholipid transport system substrate-binding protein